MMYDTTKPYIPEIERLIWTTWNTKYLRVDKYGVRKKPGAPQGPEWRHTDGIGLKGEDHWRMRTFGFAVQDALAMNLNDCVRDRAIAFEICDHIFLPVDDHEAMISVVSHLVYLTQNIDNFQQYRHRCTHQTKYIKLCIKFMYSELYFCHDIKGNCLNKNN